MTRLLLVEDEMSVATPLIDVLQVKGFGVDHVTSGEDAAARLQAGGYDLVLLDAMLAGAVTGYDVVRQARLRHDATPIIMLTARGTEMDKVLGFELGVDDYVTKPFSLMELLGRIGAVLRRSVNAGGSAGGLDFGAVRVDLERFAVSGGRDVSLPTRAFEILKVLVARRGQAVSRDTLIDEVWGVDESVTPRTLDNLMVKIRQAIEEDPEHPRFLKTIHGVGYRLDMTNP